MNLLVTCARNLETETKNEIEKILGEVGDQEPEILNVGMRGILMINTNIEPSKIIDWVKDKITEVAKIFPNKVSLNQPDWVILIEILADKTGISILKENEIFSLDKAKRMSD